ncbi:VOC family protein [Spirillospora sp. CA-142024]|uniref:VOC family protein n=1 Tax=Spirillospora sp. CA-142024 TaxID=3240036 RepID=UPI003D90D9D4
MGTEPSAAAERTSAGVRISGIVIDAVDLERMALFWSRLLDLEITRREDEWISLGSGLALQRVPEPKSVKNRLHLDLVADDLESACARAAELGAVPAGALREDLWQVWKDPEGNEFCICRS